MIQKKEPD